MIPQEAAFPIMAEACCTYEPDALVRELECLVRRRHLHRPVRYVPGGAGAASYDLLVAGEVVASLGIAPTQPRATISVCAWDLRGVLMLRALLRQLILESLKLKRSDWVATMFRALTVRDLNACSPYEGANPSRSLTVWDLNACPPYGGVPLSLVMARIALMLGTYKSVIWAGAEDDDVPTGLPEELTFATSDEDVVRTWNHVADPRARTVIAQPEPAAPEPAAPEPPREAQFVALFERTYWEMKKRGEVKNIPEWMDIHSVCISERQFREWRRRYK